MYEIYAIENKANGKSYIGMTKDVKVRWLGHRSSYSKSAISADIREFGLTNFGFRIVDNAANKAEARMKERLYIHLFESNVPEFGYNNPTLFPLNKAEQEADIAILTRKCPWLPNKDKQQLIKISKQM